MEVRAVIVDIFDRLGHGRHSVASCSALREGKHERVLSIGWIKLTFSQGNILHSERACMSGELVFAMRPGSPTRGLTEVFLLLRL